MTPATLEVPQAPPQRDALSDQIGKWLRLMRTDLRLSLPAAAAICGGVFSARALRGWESGRPGITIGDLDTILVAYGVNTSWFVGEAALRAGRPRVLAQT